MPATKAGFGLRPVPPAPVPRQSVERLGLITTMRLDVQRLLFGWNASIQPPPTMRLPGCRFPKKRISRWSTHLNIDFAALAEGEEDEEIRILHRYFASLKPSAKNAYTGKYQGYNLILITAEGFPTWPWRGHHSDAVGWSGRIQVYQLLYAAVGVSTSDGEYVACTGLIPKSGCGALKSRPKLHAPGVGNQLRRLGYQTVAYTTIPIPITAGTCPTNMGYEYRASATA